MARGNDWENEGFNPFTTAPVRAWSNSVFLIFDIRALWRSGLSARMSKIKNGGLDQYGAGSFEQQQFGKAGVEAWRAVRYFQICQEASRRM